MPKLDVRLTPPQWERVVAALDATGRKADANLAEIIRGRTEAAMAAAGAG